MITFPPSENESHRQLKSVVSHLKRRENQRGIGNRDTEQILLSEVNCLTSYSAPPASSEEIIKLALSILRLLANGRGVEGQIKHYEKTKSPRSHYPLLPLTRRADTSVLQKDMTLHPTAESVYILTDEEKNPVALIRNRILYSVDPLDNDGIAMLFNGNERLPLVPNQLNKEV